MEKEISVLWVEWIYSERRFLGTRFLIFITIYELFSTPLEIPYHAKYDMPTRKYRYELVLIMNLCSLHRILRTFTNLYSFDKNYVS